MIPAQKSQYNISEAAKILGVSAVTLRLWERQGKITSTRTVGGQRRYTLEDLEIIRQMPHPRPAALIPETPSPKFKFRLSSPQKKVLAGTFVALAISASSFIAAKSGLISLPSAIQLQELTSIFQRPASISTAVSTAVQGAVLASQTVLEDLRFTVNVPAVFKKPITAPNVLYSLKAGTGIEVGGGQTPTITNTDLGSAQKIFKTVKAGSTEFSAGSNTDTLTFAGGTGISISSSTSDKKLTISASGSDLNVSGFTDDGTLVRLTTAGDIVSVGSATGSAKLSIEGAGYVGDIFTASQSGNLLAKLTNTGQFQLPGLTASRALFTDASSSLTTTAASSVLAASISDETGNGALVFGTSPTLTTPVIAQIVNTGTLTLPTSTDTLVGRATTDTLTNKTWNGVKISETYGGTNQSTYATGDMLYASASNTLAKLGIGSSNQVLIVSGGVPSWTSNPSGSGSGAFGYWTRTGTTLSTTNAGDNVSLGGTLTLPNSNTLTGQTGNIQLSGGVSVGGGTTYYVNTSGNANFNTLNAAGTTLGGTTVTSLTDSGSASVSGAFTLYGTPTLATTAKQSLTLGDTNTGNIILGQPITSGTWNGSAIGATYGGTNQTTYTTGDILYASATNTLAKLGVGSNTQVLTVSGGIPVWTANTSIGNWQRNSGTVSPLNITDDVLVGGISTAAATLRISAAGTVTLPNSNTLTGVSGYLQLANGISVGGATTYYINNLGTANLNGLTAGTTSLGGTTITSLTDSGSASVSGALTLYTTPTIATTAKQTLTLGDSNTGNVVVTNNLSAANLSGTNTGDQTITLTGDVTGSGTGSFATTIGALKVTNGMLAGGITEVKGGTGQSTYTTGDILYSSATNTLSKLGIGSANQVLSVVSGIPGWVASGSVGTNYWNVSSGALFPLSSTADLLVGGQSTASAKFAFINVNSGTPTASVSGNLVLDSAGVIATTKKQTLTLGDANTGNIAFGQTITSGTWNGTKISEVYGGTNQSSYTTGDILYASGTNTLTKLAVGVTGKVLAVSGGVPTWATISGSSCLDCIVNDPSSIQTITPTADVTGLRVALASGGTNDIFSVTNNGSTSKYFAITSGGAATVSGTLILFTNPTIATTAKQSLTLGDSNTGNIVLTNPATTSTINSQTISSSANLTGTLTLAGILTANSSATISGNLALFGTPTIVTANKQSLTLGDANTGNIALANAAVLSSTLTLPNSNTFTGVSGYAQASGGISVGGGTTYYINNLGTANLNGLTAGTTSLGGTTVTSLTDTGSASVSGALTLYTTPTIATTAKQSLTLGDTNTGNIILGQPITSGTWNGSAIGTTYGGTNQTTYTTGDILYASATNTLSKLAIGSTSQVLTVTGGVPVWGAGASSSNWQRNSGAIAPLNITDDLLVGGISTASAKFAVVSSSGNTGISGTLTLPNTNTLTGISGYTQASAGLSVGGGTTYYINNLGTANLNAVTVNSTLNVTGATTLTGALTANSTASVSGALTLYGTPTLATTAKQSLTLGDANTGNIILNGGNVGIGTTSPLSKLHVEGACVTADTLIRRKKKKKRKGETDEWEDVPITDIEAGDEILTLDEKMGEFVISTVRQLMPMGIQQTYLMLTESGKQIRTTAKHPYLARPSRSAGLIIGGTYQIDQSPRLETLTQDSFVAVANKHVQFVTKISKKDKLWLKKLYGKRGRSRYYGMDVFANSIALLLRATGIRDAKIQIDREYSGHEQRINEIIRREAGDIQIEYVSVGHNLNSYAHYAAYGAFLGKRKVDITIKSDRGALKGVGLGIVTHKDKSFMTGDTRGRLPKVYQQPLEMSSDAKWKKVYELTVGMQVATSDGWETIIALKKFAREQVYDLEIENTHNFVANGIVAHNTTGKALTILNETGDQNILVASASGVTKFTLDRSGNIGSATWNGSIIGPAYGGTGIANNAASTLTISGNYATTLTLTGTTGVTLPTTGTLATLAGTETLTNKTLVSPVVTTGLTTGSTIFALLNTTATTVNFAGAATALNIGAATGTTTIANAASVSGALTLYGTPTLATTAKQSLTLGDANTGNIILNGGNVGIGTTNPLSKLHIEGACITGDALLPIKRRKKKRLTDTDEDEADTWDEFLCRMDQIVPGDQVLSLNEATAGLEWRTVNLLMDQGIREVYEIVTCSGRRIKTTANHPYLTLLNHE